MSAHPNTFASLVELVKRSNDARHLEQLRGAGIRSLSDVRRSHSSTPPGVEPALWKRIVLSAGLTPPAQTTQPPQLVRPHLRSYTNNFSGVVDWLRDNNILGLTEAARTCGVKRPLEILDNVETMSRASSGAPRQIFREAIRADSTNLFPSTPSSRTDFPTVKSSTRGSILAALEAAAPDSQRSALNELEDAKFANSSRIARDALWRTWTKIAAAWGLPPLPLTSDLVNKIGASLKRGGYRSASNYFSRAREEHLRLTGLPVPESVNQSIRQTTRAVERGALAERPKEAFELETFASTSSNTSPMPEDTSLYTSSISFATNFTVIGAWWMTREIEIAAAKKGDVEIRHSDRTVRWRLPSSKADQAGRGVVRSHGCACNRLTSSLASGCDYDVSKICPYHLMKAHLQAIDKEDPTSPLFPSKSGQFLTKEESVQLIRAAVTNTFGPSIELERIDRLGGHSLRVSGAQAMARAGIDVVVIQLMGRWGSSTVLRYIQEAPLERSHLIASSFAKSCTQSNLDAASDTHLQEGLCDADNTTENPTISSASAITDAPRDPPSSPPTSTPGKGTSAFAPSDDLVQNLRTNVTHRSCGPLIGDSNTWSLRCGWKFTRSQPGYSVLPRGTQPTNRCPRCFRRDQQTDEPSDDTSSSDSSESDS